jgi:hypothetical protein
MATLFSGIMAGIAAAIFMGAASEIAYRMGLFNSSLLLIDGSFFLRFTRKESGKGDYLAGIPVHLFTGAVFGAIYVGITYFFGLNPFLPGLVAFYFFLLWLSMLFIALPIAGLGMLGRKASPRTWLEQLFLHVIFGVGYYYSLVALA